jgi:hypothetical protein
MIKWIKKKWHILVGMMCGIIGIVVLVLKAKGIIDAVLGKVNRSDKFTILPGTDDRIMVKSTDGWIETRLPSGVKAKNVSAVEYTENKKVIVEVLHEIIDRRVSYGSDSDMGL